MCFDFNIIWFSNENEWYDEYENGIQHKLSNYKIFFFLFPSKFIYLFSKYKSPNKTTYLKKCAQVLTQKKKKKKKVPKFKSWEGHGMVHATRKETNDPTN